jgi:hypothetical protein
MLLSFYCAISLINALAGLYFSIITTSDDGLLGLLVRAPHPITYILIVLFYTGSLLSLTRKPLMSAFKVSKNTMDTTFIFALLTGVLLILLQV